MWDHYWRLFSSLSPATETHAGDNFAPQASSLTLCFSVCACIGVAFLSFFCALAKLTFFFVARAALTVALSTSRSRFGLSWELGIGTPPERALQLNCCHKHNKKRQNKMEKPVDTFVLYSLFLFFTIFFLLADRSQPTFYTAGDDARLFPLFFFFV